MVVLGLTVVVSHGFEAGLGNTQGQERYGPSRRILTFGTGLLIIC